MSITYQQYEAIHQESRSLKHMAIAASGFNYGVTTLEIISLGFRLARFNTKIHALFSLDCAICDIQECTHLGKIKNIVQEVYDIVSAITERNRIWHLILCKQIEKLQYNLELLWVSSDSEIRDMAFQLADKFTKNAV